MLQYATAVSDFFTARETFLINKNRRLYQDLVDLNSAKSFDQTMTDFVELGNKRFKSKMQNMQYLALYECLLNHGDLIPSDESLDNLYNALLNKVLQENEMMVNDESEQEEGGEEIEAPVKSLQFQKDAGLIFDNSGKGIFEQEGLTQNADDTEKSKDTEKELNNKITSINLRVKREDVALKLSLVKARIQAIRYDLVNTIAESVEETVAYMSTPQIEDSRKKDSDCKDSRKKDLDCMYR